MEQISCKKITVYLDFATIPSLSYFLHFVKTNRDQNTIRLFGLGRFTIPNSIISRYPEGIIQFYPVVNHNFSALVEALENIINTITGKCIINLHLNGMHHQEMLLPFLNLYLEHRMKIDDLQLFIYDDGADAIATLRKIAQNPNLDLLIEKERSNMLNLEQSRYLETSFLTRYFWGMLFKTKYYFFNQRVFSDPRLSILKKELDEYELINLKQFHQLDDEQKKMMLEIFNIDAGKINYLREVLEQHNSFLFLGTTLFNVDEDTHKWLEDFHIDLLKQYCLKDGMFFNNKEGYLFFFKGHPVETNITKRVLQEFDFIAVLPESIPLEIFALLGVLPQRVGGFCSSAIFNYDIENIDDVIFTTPVEYHADHHLYSQQYHFMHSLIELGYLTPEKAHSYIDVINRLTN